MTQPSPESARASTAAGYETNQTTRTEQQPAELATLAARVKADPALWDKLSNSQRVALGYQQRQAERDQAAERERQTADQATEDQILAGYLAAGIGTKGSTRPRIDPNKSPTGRQREQQRFIADKEN